MKLDFQICFQTELNLQQKRQAHSLYSYKTNDLNLAALYKLILFKSSHPVFCYYMTVFSCYNKACTTFAWK